MPAAGSTRLVVALTLAVAVFTLSGCSTPAGPAQKTATADPGDSANKTGSNMSRPEERDLIKGTRITIPCDSLITPTQLLAINPHLTPSPDYHPAAGSHAETIVGFEGVACAWFDRVTDQIIEVAVAQLPDAAITSLKNEAITVSTPVPTYGAWPQIEGYFQKTAGTGVATVFRGSYWIVSSSTAYFEPGDAQLIAESVLKALP